VTLAFALVTAGIVAGAPTAPWAVSGPSDDMCKEPAAATTESIPVSVSGVTMQVPSNFGVTSTSSYYQTYSTNNVTVQLLVGHAMPQQPSTVTLTKCHVTLGDRPATITLYSVPATVSTVSPQEGRGLTRGSPYTPQTRASTILLAEWPASDGIGIVQVVIWAEYQSDLLAIRQLLWTIHFPGYAAAKSIDPSCAKTPAAASSIGDVLDTGVVSMLASGASPRFPIGSAIFEFTFDSTGAMGPLSILRASIPDSAARRLAMLVGSNVKDQAPGAKRVGVRVEVTADGLIYSGVPLSACGQP
jgi:hypothetical protein